MHKHTAHLEPPYKGASGVSHPSHWVLFPFQPPHR